MRQLTTSTMLLLWALAASPVHGIRTVYEASDVYHPGHPPHHVTRLHRYEHEGIQTMLEEEARWMQDIDSSFQSTNALKEVRRIRGSSFIEESQEAHQESETSEFVKISRVQSKALQEHHQSWLSWLQTSKDESMRKQNGSSRQKTAPEAALVQKYKSYLASVGQGQAKDGLVPATGLSSLSSQYVGPIGVGTVISPPGCIPKQAAAATEGNSSLLGKIGNLFSSLHSKAPNVSTVASSFEQSCTVEDQSKIWVVFDTGSTNIWIASELCKSGACQLPGRHRFNHSASATFNYPQSMLQLKVQFGTGSITGPQAVDDFHIGPFTVYNQTFAMIETESGSVFRDVPFEGIVGMAFDKMSANHVQPFFSSMIEQKALHHNEFAFYFSKDKPSANALLWGGVDKKFYEGKLKYFPVIDPYYWSLKLLSLKIGIDTILGPADTYNGSANTDRTWKGPVAVADTGTTFFTVDDTKYSDVMSKLPPGHCKEVTDESHPPITITLEDKRGAPNDFVLTNKEYMTQDGNHCSPAFMSINLPAEHGPGMILGDVFLRKWFAVFDRDTGKDSDAKIAFARASHAPETLAHLRELTADQPAFSGGQSQQLDNVN